MLFGKNKKNEDQQNELARKLDENAKKINNEIIVHSMPEKFIASLGKSNQAKKMGIFIFAMGALFLIIISIILYIYLFKMPKASVTSEETQLQTEDYVSSSTASQSVNNEAIIPIQLEQIQSTSTPVEENDLADETASSTEDNMATTTPEEISRDLGEKMLDSDQDGLTLAEENLFGTDSAKADSDADGYVDGEEVKNLYNPAGEGKIANNAGIKEYINPTYKYSNLFPSAWAISELGGNDSVIFKSEDNHIIQINTQPNSSLKNISDWYKLQFGLAPESSNLLAGENWSGAASEDGLNYYITDNSYNYIYIISYNPEFETSHVYVNLLKMMVKSFKIESK